MTELKSRKLTYIIGYIHILTFKEHIKKIIAPYFSYEPLEYGIDNEGTMQENIRLIFRSSGFILQFNKELATLVYEGDIAEVKKSNPHVEMFFEIYEKIKSIDTFVTTKYHNMSIDSVGFLQKEIYSDILTQNKFLYNPFGDLDEFAAAYEFVNDSKVYKFNFGNYHEKDISQRNLTPFKSEFNKELIGEKGIISQLSINQDLKSPSFNKFKDLIHDAERVLAMYLK